MEQKISIRFFDDAEVRAIWDDEHSKGYICEYSILARLVSFDFRPHLGKGIRPLSRLTETF